MPSAYPQFVGELAAGEDGAAKGMSGGPIFGIVKGFGAHRVIAVQSARIGEDHLTFGFPVSTMAKLVERELGRSNK